MTLGTPGRSARPSAPPDRDRDSSAIPGGPCASTSRGAAASRPGSIAALQSLKAIALDRRCLASLTRTVQNLAECRAAHAKIIEAGSRDDIYLTNLLLVAYGKCGSVENAWKTFDRMRSRNLFTWSNMITGCIHGGAILDARDLLALAPATDLTLWNGTCTAFALIGHPQDAKALFDIMPERDKVTWNVMIRAFALDGQLHESKRFLSRMPFWGIIAWTTIFKEYALGGHLDEAKAIFDAMPDKDEIAWTLMLHGLLRHGQLDQGKVVFDSMERRDLLAYTALASAFAKGGQIEEARLIFSRQPQFDNVSWTAMIQALAKDVACLDEAKSLFDSTPLDRCPVSWTSMLQSYIQASRLKEAKALFGRMSGWDIVSWTAMIFGYAENGHYDEAQRMFSAYPDRRNAFSYTAMLTAASREGDLAYAKGIFTAMREKNLVTWNAMYTAYAQHGDISKAKEMFVKIPERNIVSWNIMIFVYSEVGNVEAAKVYYDDLPEKNIISWNLMIGAYAHNGYPRDAHGIFHEMALHGSRIDEMSFSSVLVACSHIGLVRDARNYFVMLHDDFQLTPLVDHYCCIVDALSRAGKLQFAEELIESMPFPVSDVAIASLVSACRIYNDPHREARVARMFLDVDPGDSSAYVALIKVLTSETKGQ